MIEQKINYYINEFKKGNILPQYVITSEFSFLLEDIPITKEYLVLYRSKNFSDIEIPIADCKSGFFKRLFRSSKELIYEICGSSYEEQFPTIKINKLDYSNLFNFYYLKITNQLHFDDYAQAKLSIDLNENLEYKVSYRMIFTNSEGANILKYIKKISPNILKPYMNNNALMIGQIIFVDESEYLLNNDYNKESTSFCQFAVYDMIKICNSSIYNAIKNKPNVYPVCKEEFISRNCFNAEQNIELLFFNKKIEDIFFTFDNTTPLQNGLKNDLFVSHKSRAVFRKNKPLLIKCEYSQDLVSNYNIVLDEKNKCYFKRELQENNWLNYLLGISLFFMGAMLVTLYVVKNYFKKNNLENNEIKQRNFVRSENTEEPYIDQLSKVSLLGNGNFSTII